MIGQRFYGGFSSGIKYKAFELEFLIQFVKQTGFDYSRSIGVPGAPVNQPTVVLDRWRQQGDITAIQKFTQDFGSEAATAYYNNYSFGDGAIVDASFVRFKSLSLSYQVETKKNKIKIGLEKFANLFTRSKPFHVYQLYRIRPRNTTTYSSPTTNITTGIQLNF